MKERQWKQALENHLLHIYTRVRDAVNLLHILNWQQGIEKGGGTCSRSSWPENEPKHHRRRRNKSVVISALCYKKIYKHISESLW